MTLPEVRLGERLAEAIAGAAVSKGEFAKRIGVSASYLSQVLGNRKTPGAEFLLALRRAFDVDLNWLLSGELSASAATFDPGLFNEVAMTTVIAKLASDRSLQLAQALLTNNPLPVGTTLEDARHVLDEAAREVRVAMVIGSLYREAIAWRNLPDRKQRIEAAVETHLAVVMNADLAHRIVLATWARKAVLLAPDDPKGAQQRLKEMLASTSIEGLIAEASTDMGLGGVPARTAPRRRKRTVGPTPPETPER